MATNDGYSPYPLGLTAADATNAIRRSFNLDTEFLGYVRFESGTTPPSILNTKNGDFWQSSDTNKLYRAHVDGTALIWFEV